METGELTIGQLQGILTENLNWSEYHARAYCVLVMNGEMEVKDIELEANIPNSRVYGVLSKLEEQGVVKKKGRRPKSYDAIHPRDVISGEVDQFRRKSEQAKSRLEQAWEANRSLSVDDEDTWALGSTQGVVNQVRSAIESANDSIYAIDSNLRWISREDREKLTNVLEQGVDVGIIGMDGQKPIDRLADEGIPAYQTSQIHRNYYIIDGERIVIRMNSGGSGVSFTDSSVASIFTEDFEEVREEATEVTPLAP